MIRQTAFNQILKELRLGGDEVKDIPALFVAFQLGRNIMEQRADLRMGIDGVEISIGDFTVSGDGDIQIDYHSPRNEDDRRPDAHGARLMLGYELDFIMNNTWFHQPDLSIQPTAVERRDDEDRPAHRVRREDHRRERLEAHKHMGDVDLNILRTLASGTYTQALQLMRGFWAVTTPQKEHKRLEVGTVVYNLHERDRLNAAWEVRAKGLTRNQDYELIHLRTGGVEPAFSGDYGTVQEWLKYQNGGRGRMVENIILNDDESEFLHRASAYITGKYRAKDK